MSVRNLARFISITVFCFAALNASSENRIPSLRRELASHPADTAAIRLCLELSKEYMTPGSFNQDSTLHYASKALELSKTLGSQQLLYDIHLQYARILEMTGNFSLAMEYLFSYLKQSEKWVDPRHRSVKQLKENLSIYGSIANDYVGLSNYEKALDYYQKTRMLLDELKDSLTEDQYTGKMQVLMNNIGSVYLSSRQYDSALVYLRAAVRINTKLNNAANLAAALNNIGIIFKVKGEFDSAYQYYQKALEIRQDLGDTRGIAQIYNNLGDYYILLKEYPKAISVLSDALDLSRKMGSLQSQMKAAWFLTDAYSKTGNYRNALEMQQLYQQLNDSIVNIDNVKRTTQLELQYQFDMKKREAELAQQQALARKERNTLIMALVAGIFLFGLVIVFLLYYLQRNKARRSRIELDFRNKELTTHVMYLLQKNEFIVTISRKLMEIKDKLDADDRKELLEIVRQLQSNVDSTVWEEFEVRFQEVHQDFHTNLNRRFPDLTPNEKRICAFLRLNMTTKEISAITSQSPKSLQVARTRLRKKLGIERDENLVSFLQQF